MFVDKAKQQYVQAVGKRNSAAANHLGYLYMPQSDRERAVRLYEIAVRLGDSGAAYTLVEMYGNGMVGVVVDEATEENDDTEVCVNLAGALA